MAKSSVAGLLTSVDEIFTTQEEREEAKLSKIVNMPLSLIDDFPGHPYHVRMDEDMDLLVDSVKKRGILVPVLVMPKDDGRYLMVSGHRRKKACELAGLETIRAEVRELTMDEAIVEMVDSNLQRSSILPSEKAFAYKMKLDALKHQGQRRDLTLAPVVPKLPARDKIAQDAGEKSGMAITRYIALTKLIPPLLVLVDEEKLSVTSAADYISDLSESEQTDLVTVMDKLRVIPARSQLVKIKESSKAGTLTVTVIETLLSVAHPAAVQVVLKQARLHQYFPQSYTAQQMEEVIVSLLETWSIQHR